MKRLSIFVILICLFTIAGCKKDQPVSSITFNAPVSAYNTAMKRDILCLMLVYPGYVVDVEKKSDDRVYIIMESGKQILYDDKKTKSYAQKLYNCDLQDMMEQVYPLSEVKDLMPQDFDPGRFRAYDLFKEVYGSSKKQVQSNLISVNCSYTHLLFNRNNNAANALKAAMEKVTLLSQKRKGLYAFVFPVGGTFNYRYIAGTNLLSVHSFGTAIDLAVNKHDYWKWATREQGQKRLEAYPKEIVQIFEENNFIWGGKWGHFDLMHYEYRPELILKAKYFATDPKPGEPWYSGIPYSDEEAQKYIELINKRLDQ